MDREYKERNEFDNTRPSLHKENLRRVANDGNDKHGFRLSPKKAYCMSLNKSQYNNPSQHEVVNPIGESKLTVLLSVQSDHSYAKSHLASIENTSQVNSQMLAHSNDRENINLATSATFTSYGKQLALETGTNGSHLYNVVQPLKPSVEGITNESQQDHLINPDCVNSPGESQPSVLLPEQSNSLERISEIYSIRRTHNESPRQNQNLAPSNYYDEKYSAISSNATSIGDYAVRQESDFYNHFGKQLAFEGATNTSQLYNWFQPLQQSQQNNSINSKVVNTTLINQTTDLMSSQSNQQEETSDIDSTSTTCSYTYLIEKECPLQNSMSAKSNDQKENNLATRSTFVSDQESAFFKHYGKQLALEGAVNGVQLYMLCQLLKQSCERSANLSAVNTTLINQTTDLMSSQSNQQEETSDIDSTSTTCSYTYLIEKECPLQNSMSAKSNDQKENNLATRSTFVSDQESAFFKHYGKQLALEGAVNGVQPYMLCQLLKQSCERSANCCEQKNVINTEIVNTSEISRFANVSFG